MPTHDQRLPTSPTTLSKPGRAMDPGEYSGMRLSLLREERGQSGIVERGRRGGVWDGRASSEMIEAGPDVSN